MPRPEISVVIPAYNCEHTIAKCLQSVVRMEGENYEIIVVDDGSTDRTLEICGTFDNVTTIALDKGGPSRARNQGIKTAQGEFVAFTDGDCVVDRHWLKVLHKGFVAPNIAGVGGDQISPSDETPLGKIIQDFLKVIGFVGDYVKTDASMKETEHNPSCNVMYRKRVLGEVGGFDEALWPGEDVDLDFKIRRAGYKLLFDPEASVAHYRPSTYKAYGRMMKRYGGAQRYLIKKYGPFRRIHYEPLALGIVVVLILGFLYLMPSLWPALTLIILLPCSLFLFRTKSASRTLVYLLLLVITLVCWNWGFAVGLGDNGTNKTV